MNVFQYSMLYCLQFKRLNEREMCMEPNEKFFTLAENFSASAKILTAIGDETRQHLILEMMKMGNCMVFESVILQRKQTFPVRRFPITCKLWKTPELLKYVKREQKIIIILTPKWRPLNSWFPPYSLPWKFQKNCRTEVVNKETKLGVNLQCIGTYETAA